MLLALFLHLFLLSLGLSWQFSTLLFLLLLFQIWQKVTEALLRFLLLHNHYLRYQSPGNLLAVAIALSSVLKSAMYFLQRLLPVGCLLQWHSYPTDHLSAPNRHRPRLLFAVSVFHYSVTVLFELSGFLY
ncbi:hypothetical protein D9M72_548580 [compost metagenome]